jgi:2-methylcitrate dehydratase
MSGSISRRSMLAAFASSATTVAWAQTPLAPASANESSADAAAPPNIAQRMARYIVETEYGALDPTTIEAAKAHLIDSIGCAISACHEDVVRACRDVALAVPGGVSTVMGTRRRTTPDLATFANGAAIRCFDFNDLYFGREPGHPSDNISACLAIAEAEGRSGRDFLLAMVLAYEIDCRLLDAAELTLKGWDHPINSLPASALAAGKLMGLPAGKLEQAVNIALNGHLAMNQTRVQVLSDWKNLADADAGRNGVFAALLARQGITGPSPIYEGNAGFFKMVSGPFEIDVDQFGGRKGQFRINACGVKPYPAQGAIQTAILAAAEIAKEVGDLEQIAAIALGSTDFTYRSAARDKEKWAPETKETADHSLPYVVARAMLDGKITLDSFSPNAIHDPKALALMAKMTVKADPELTAMMPKKIPIRISATLKDGRAISRQVDAVPGLGGMPLQRGDFERKFSDNVGKIWSEARQRRVLDFLWNIDRQDKLDHLFELVLVET